MGVASWQGVHGNQWLDLLEGGRPDAVNIEQIIDGFERAIRIAVVDDALGDGRADAGQGIQLFKGGGVDVDRAVWRRSGRSRRRLGGRAQGRA
jgi:hypothetical protein